MSLGVYICALNEDRFILDCIKPALEVFPDLTVIDLGSTDNTIDKVRSQGVSLICEKMNHPSNFPVIKNKHSDKHEKVIWIDADEIYPVPALEKLKRDIENPGPYKGIRTSYKMIKSDKGLWISNEIFSAGVKAHYTSYFYYVRAAPNDYIRPRNYSVYAGSKKKSTPDFDYYFWHCVLMNRSSKKEDTARSKKRAVRLGEFDKLCTWVKLEEFPWEV